MAGGELGDAREDALLVLMQAFAAVQYVVRVALTQCAGVFRVNRGDLVADHAFAAAVVAFAQPE